MDKCLQQTIIINVEFIPRIYAVFNIKGITKNKVEDCFVLELQLQKKILFIVFFKGEVFFINWIISSFLSIRVCSLCCNIFL